MKLRNLFFKQRQKFYPKEKKIVQLINEKLDKNRHNNTTYGLLPKHTTPSLPWAKFNYFKPQTIVLVVGPTWIWFPHLLIHVVGCDLTDCVEEYGKSSDRCSLGEVDLISSTCVIGLVWEDLDWFNGLMASTSALGRWSLRACARILPGCHQQVMSAQ